MPQGKEARRTAEALERLARIRRVFVVLTGGGAQNASKVFPFRRW